jgi:hypothetical protein
MTFPVDWDEWYKEWSDWKTKQRLNYVSSTFPGKNMLADDILGTYRVMGRVVELSEVTMPDFGARPERTLRYVGITWMVDGKCVNGGLVDSFEELTSALAHGPKES